MNAFWRALSVLVSPGSHSSFVISERFKSGFRRLRRAGHAGTLAAGRDRGQRAGPAATPPRCPPHPPASALASRTPGSRRSDRSTDLPVRAEAESGLPLGLSRITRTSVLSGPTLMRPRHQRSSRRAAGCVGAQRHIRVQWRGHLSAVTEARIWGTVRVEAQDFRSIDDEESCRRAAPASRWVRPGPRRCCGGDGDDAVVPVARVESTCGRRGGQGRGRHAFPPHSLRAQQARAGARSLSTSSPPQIATTFGQPSETTREHQREPSGTVQDHRDPFAEPVSLRRRPCATPLSLLFLKLSGYYVNAVQLHTNAADVLVRCCIHGAGS